VIAVTRRASMTSRDGISPVAAPSCTPNRCKRRDAVASRDERRDAFRARRAVETNDAFSPASDRALPRRDARHRVSAPSTRPPVASRRPSRDAQKFSLVAVKKSTPPRGALSISIPHAVPVPPACDVFDASHAGHQHRVLPSERAIASARVAPAPIGDEPP